MKFNEVIEEHRLSVGAESLHVSLGPNATPEGLRSELAKIKVLADNYNKFSDLEKEKAKVARLKRQLSKICALAKTSIYDFSTQSAEVSKLKHDIFYLSDYFVDIDLYADAEWMRLKLKNGKVLAAEEKEIFK